MLFRIWACVFLAVVVAILAAPSTIHYDNAKLLICRLTHKPTPDANYTLMSCDYRCDRPVVATVDAATMDERVACRDPLPVAVKAE